MRFALSLGLLLLASSDAAADDIVGRASVIDGDTIEIHGERIRILDVDAPESRQPCLRPDSGEWRCGQEASLALADWIGARTVTCATDKLDKYRRHLARCAVAGHDIAEWLATNGWAVPYRDCKCEVIRDAAERARAAKVGVWAGSFTMPWEWRGAKSEGLEPTPAWRDQLQEAAATRLGKNVPYVLDALLVGLGAALGIVIYILFKSIRRHGSSRRSAQPFSFPRRRSRLMASVLRAAPVLLLLAAGAAFWWHEERFGPAVMGFSSDTKGCVIKGNISASGERIYHVPGNRYYAETNINESRGERWFCSESEAVAAGWRPAKV